MNRFLESQWGQVALAFLRVSVATLVACWVNAGMPVRELGVDNLASWAELAVQAGAALVIANYIGPWENRYGLHRESA